MRISFPFYNSKFSICVPGSLDYVSYKFALFFYLVIHLKTIVAPCASKTLEMVLGNGSYDEFQKKRGHLGTGERCGRSRHTSHQLELGGLRESHEENTEN